MEDSIQLLEINLYSRGELSSFRVLAFLDVELLDEDRELRSLLELELFEDDVVIDDDFDFELLLLLPPDLIFDFGNNLFGDREFLCF